MDKEDNSKYYDTLRKSPMFQLSLSSKELFHSNFLYWISQTDKIAFKEIITTLYAQGEGEFDELSEWPDKFEVKREYNNYDLCVLDKNRNIWFVIENKVKSIPSLSQLERYSKDTRAAYHLLLSLSTHFPARNAIINLKWTIADYGTLSTILKKYITRDNVNLDEYHKAIIKDYSEFIEALDRIQNSWAVTAKTQGQEFFLSKDSADLKDLRINDLKEKHKYSSICTLLYDQLHDQREDKDCVKWGSGRDNIFSVTQRFNKPQIFLGWGMTRAQGLLEVKILIAKDIALVIQIQGSQYRHCIELGDNINMDLLNSRDNWAENSIYTPAAWFFRAKGSEMPFTPFVASPMAIKPDTIRKGKTLGYNKYNDNFFYQSISIPANATVKEVIDMVKLDCMKIYNHFLI